MKSTILAIAITTAASLLCAHGEEEKAPVYRLLDKIDFTQSSMDSARAMFKPFLNTMREQGIAEEAMVEISDAADRFFQKTYDNPLLMEEVAQVYSKIFTDAEIEELILFYDTPLGQKTIVTMPRVMEECAGIGMKFAQKHQADFQAEIAGILEKHQPGQEKEPEEAPEEESPEED